MTARTFWIGFAVVVVGTAIAVAIAFGVVRPRQCDSAQVDARAAIDRGDLRGADEHIRGGYAVCTEKGKAGLGQLRASLDAAYSAQNAAAEAKMAPARAAQQAEIAKKRDRMKRDGIDDAAEAARFYQDTITNVIAMKQKVADGNFYIYGNIGRIEAIDDIGWIVFDVGGHDLKLGLNISEPALARLKPGMQFGATCGPTLEERHGVVLVGKCRPYTLQGEFLQPE